LLCFIGCWSFRLRLGEAARFARELAAPQIVGFISAGLELRTDSSSRCGWGAKQSGIIEIASPGPEWLLNWKFGSGSLAVLYDVD